MSAVDFAHSYMTWFPNDQGNIARIQLDAACTLYDERAATSETFYLIAPCRAERMYVDTPLFLMPNYEFAAIWGQDAFVLIRTHWSSARDNREHGFNRVRWADVHLDVRPLAATRLLTDAAAIVEATLANRPLVARTELWDEAHSKRARLEYPVKTMNLMKDPPRFQVDTGPLILPDFASGAPHAVERFDLAHVVYNAFDKAEFILRRPTPIAEGASPTASTTDYSLVQVLPARNDLYCGPA